MTMAAAPFRIETRTHSAVHSTSGSDMDAEGDEDMEEEEHIEATPGAEVADEDAEGSDVSVEAGSEEDESGDEDDDVFEAVVQKPRRPVRMVDSDAESVEDGSDDQESSAVDDDAESDKDSSDEESVAAEPWEAGSEGAEEASVQLENRNNCIFCGQDEENDPGEEFEEYMACAVCGDNSHRHCARLDAGRKTDDDISNWRCPTCLDNDLEPASPQEAPTRRRSSATKFTKDLLPNTRGGSRPGSHSVFNNLILDSDPLDGSRSLRKRKSPSEQQEEPKKRPRKQTPLANELEAVGIIKGVEKRPESVVEEDEESESASIQKPRPSRSHKKKPSEETSRRSASVVEKRKGSIVVSFPLDPGKLAELSKSKKKKRPRPHESKVDEKQVRERPIPSFASHYATPFYAFHERENDELKSKPYGGVLSEADADTSRTLPLQADRVRFNEARQKAEEDWKQRLANSEAEGESKARTQKLAGPPSKIKCVNFGGYEIETWYAAPYPEEYSRNRALYICEFCLKYMNSDFVAWRHKLKCPAKHPPGDEIYRDGSVSVFEVDGRKNPVYCQNLCLLAKLFLGSKTLYYDVEPFLFYVMTEYDEYGCHFVGYFSKEKRPSSQNNVSCILTLPTHQRKGYGNLLISFSYLLTRVEEKTGSPEKPLSDMGLVSYRNYWRLVLSYELLNQKQPLSIVELSNRTGMTADDIVAALEGLRALVRDPVTKTYALRLDYDYFQQCIDDWEAKKYVTLNPNALVWTPYIMGRNNLAHYETAPALPTIAPREDEEELAAPEEGVQQTAKADAIASKQNEAKADESAIVDGDALQPIVNGNISDSSRDIESIDPAFSQLVGSTTVPPASFQTPAKPLPASSPKTNGITNTSAPQLYPSIPPIRYEVFPPIPGTAARKQRGGWRGGPRKSAANGASTPSGTPSLRRTNTGPGIGKGKPNGLGKDQKEGTPTTTRRTRLSGALNGGTPTPKNAGSEDENEEAEDDGDDTVLANENDVPVGEKDADGDEVMADEAAADADYGEGEDAEGDSEAESEEDATDD